MSELPFELIILIPSVIGIVTSILYLREYFLRKKVYQEQQTVNLQTRQKSIELLNAAKQAETQILAEGDYATQKLISDFKIQLQNLIQNSQTSVTNSQDQLIRFMEDLQKRAAEFEEASKNATEQRINQLFERLEDKLSDFLIQTEQKTTSSIELELKAARELVETYKTQQLKLIDENIVAMLEKTLSIVLAKKLSLKDQLDLVYESLEKAKSEKFVI